MVGLSYSSKLLGVVSFAGIRNIHCSDTVNPRIERAAREVMDRGVPYRTCFKYAMIALRSVALSKRKAMSVSGTTLSGPAIHLSSEAAPQVMCELFSASE